MRDRWCGGRWGWSEVQRGSSGVQEFSMVRDGRVYYLSGLGCGLRRFAITNVSGQPAKQVNYGLGRNMAVSELETGTLSGIGQRFVPLWVFHVAYE